VFNAVRQSAAAFALPYEHPKLMVTAVVQEHDIAVRLDRAIKPIEEVKNGKVIDARPINGSTVVETTPPKPHVSDRRYRRM
jgi:hypothetical protein